MTAEEAKAYLAELGYVPGYSNTASMRGEQRLNVKLACRVLADAGHVADPPPRTEPPTVPPAPAPPPAAPVAPPAPLPRPRQPEDVAPRGDRPGLEVEGKAVPASVPIDERLDTVVDSVPEGEE